MDEQKQKGISSSLGILVVLLLVVVVGGVIIWQMWPKKETFPPILTSPTNETTNWNTYRNERYGFEIKYPEDWGFRESKVEKPKDFYRKYSVSFESLDIDETGAWLSMSIDIADNSEGLSPQNWFRERNERWRVQSIIQSEDEIIVAGVNAVKIIVEQWFFDRENVCLTRDNLIYVFESGCPIEGQDCSSKNSAIFSQMLSTFKFIQ
jgi:hypothetical protein